MTKNTLKRLWSVISLFSWKVGKQIEWKILHFFVSKMNIFINEHLSYNFYSTTMPHATKIQTYPIVHYMRLHPYTLHLYSSYMWISVCVKLFHRLDVCGIKLFGKWIYIIKNQAFNIAKKNQIWKNKLKKREIRKLSERNFMKRECKKREILKYLEIKIKWKKNCAKMNKSCARCSKTVYPIEELKCLDKVGYVKEKIHSLKNPTSKENFLTKKIIKIDENSKNKILVI